MSDFDNVANKNKTEHNLNWSYVPDNIYKTLITRGSGSRRQMHCWI